MGIRQEKINVDGYESVIYCEDLDIGLRGIVAIHNTNRGPACGGIRLLPYKNKEEALTDVLRLSKGMSYKSALAEIGFGGGKSVIILDPAKKNPRIFQAFGSFIDGFKGRYIAAKDMNIEAQDLLEVRKKTSHVLGIEGVANSGGDPSPVTAQGVYAALRATAEELTGNDSMSGMRVAIQGLGHVGYDLAARISHSGGKLWVTDIHETVVKKAADELGAIPTRGEDIYSVECDIFSPCAIGGILNPKTIPLLRCRAVVGCANNQLGNNSDGMKLYERGILYAPDYAANSGGIINVYAEYEGYDRKRALKKADGIYDTLKEIYRRSKAQRKPPFIIADELAEERLYARR